MIYVSTCSGNCLKIRFDSYVNFHFQHVQQNLQRFEYAFYAGAPGPRTACDHASHWRKFALTERDGITSSQSSVSKYLSIKRVNGRYVWYVEGMARTTTSYLPVLKTGDGEFIENFQLEPTLYLIHFRGNERFACVGCPVKVYRRPGSGRNSGYVDNPKVDLTGIETNSAIVPYRIVDLPPILSGNDGANDMMVSVDNGHDLTSSPNFADFHKPNDEFWLNSTVDSSQCNKHPPVGSAAYDTPSQLNTRQNSAVDSDGHPETVFPPIFGRTVNAETNQEEYLLFDPKLFLLDNTVENPHPDGGGLLHYETKGKTWCSNAPRNFMNEDHCT